MKVINNSSEFDLLLTQQKSVVVDFYADWCGPCRTLTPTVEKLAEDYQGKVEIVKVNVDSNPELAMRYGISSIPTVVFIKNQQIVDRTVGLQSKGELVKRIDQLN
ncbi:MAG: thioredoxin [Niastella sp.]|nr:thioredoxin [Niastella sp.]